MRTARFSWVLLPLIAAAVLANVPPGSAAEPVPLAREAAPPDASSDLHPVVGVIHLRGGTRSRSPTSGPGG